MIRLQGSSLIEVTVATIILGIIFGISLLFFINIQKRSENLLSEKYHRQLEHMAFELKSKKVVPDNKVFMDSTITINLRVELYQNIDRLYHIELQAYRGDSVQLASYNELYYEEE